MKQLFIYMRTIQRRESELIKSVSVARRFIRSSRGLGAQDVRWTSALRGPEWNGDLPNKQKCAGYIPGHCLPMSKKERISFMIKNKVVIRERDAWSDLTNFIGEMVAYITENIEKFRSIIIPIEKMLRDDRMTV